MKRIWISLAVLAAMGATAAQEKVVQPGVPALLEAVNGKKAKVFLQSLEEGNLTFQPYKSTREMTVPATKVKSLTFYPKYDAEAIEVSFAQGDYPAMVAVLDPLLEPFWEYMVVDNNLREAFCRLMDAHRGLGEFSKVRKAAALLLDSGDPDLVQRGQVGEALAAIDGGDLPVAEGIRAEITSEAARLYLQACIEQAQQRPKDAIKTITLNILNHANDVEWLGPSELLCAHLYLDMVSSNSVVTTNSALNTARQVKNIYGGTPVAADAEKLWTTLGGPEIQAAEEKEKAERKIAEKAAKERQEAEKKKRNAEKKAKKEAEAAAQAGTEAGTNVTTTEMESE